MRLHHFDCLPNEKEQKTSSYVSRILLLVDLLTFDGRLHPFKLQEYPDSFIVGNFRNLRRHTICEYHAWSTRSRYTSLSSALTSKMTHLTTLPYFSHSSFVSPSRSSSTSPRPTMFYKTDTDVGLISERRQTVKVKVETAVNKKESMSTHAIWLQIIPENNLFFPQQNTEWWVFLRKMLIQSIYKGFVFMVWGGFGQNLNNTTDHLQEQLQIEDNVWVYMLFIPSYNSKWGIIQNGTNSSKLLCGGLVWAHPHTLNGRQKCVKVKQKKREETKPLYTLRLF